MARPDSTPLSALSVRGLARRPSSGRVRGPDAGRASGIARQLVADSSSMEMMEVSCMVATGFGCDGRAGKCLSD